MAATSNDPRNPRIVPRHGVPRILKLGTEAASQSFKAGEFVSVDASADVTVSATGASTAIYGIAVSDATGSGSASVYVQKIEQDDDLIMLITDASGSGAAHTNCKVGEDYDLLVTSNLHSVNYADVTNPAFVFVQGIDDAAGSATNYGRFRVLASVLDDGVVAS
jgi:hypothetical protein